MKHKIISSLSALTVALLLILLLIFADTAAEAAKKAMLLSVSAVVPSLFTYMILSYVITELDLLEPIYKFIPTNKLFGLPRCTSPVILTGLICGFPLGASGTKSLYDNGKITLRDAKLLVCLSSCSSPAFLIGSVGNRFGDKRFGTVLYLTSVSVIMIFGIICGKLQKNEKNELMEKKIREKQNAVEILCDSISRAAITCLTVTAYITFFSVLCALMTKLIPQLSLLFASLFEFSYGAYYGASLSGIIGAAVTGFSVGFCSLSVFMQTYNITSRDKIPLSYFTLSKIIIGTASAIAAALYQKLFPMTPVVESSSNLTDYPILRVISTIIILTAAAAACDKCRKKNNFFMGY